MGGLIGATMDAVTEIGSQLRPALDLLSLFAKCGLVAAVFTSIAWLIISYSLDWAFLR